MKLSVLFAAMALTASALASTSVADSEKYLLAPKWSQIIFSYDHLGYSRTTGMFSGIEGEIDFDKENPEGSSVAVWFPVSTMFTGLEQRDANFTVGGDFFVATENDQIEFKSTHIEVTGETTAKITGDLTMNGSTHPVTLDARMNKMGFHDKEQKDWVGFDATASVLRSEFGLGKYAPGVSDKVDISISIEAMKAE